MAKPALLFIVLVACSIFLSSNAETIQQARQRREKFLKSQEIRFHKELKLRQEKNAASLRYSEKPSYKATNGTNPDDIEALVALYKSTNGDKWTNNTGWMKGDPCDVPMWYGIYCRNKRVLQINLVNNQLSGTLPAELAKASDLQTIRLFSNFITGKIPPEIFTMPILAIFSANNNSFSGELPPEISMPNLSELVLYGNKLSGPIPTFNTPLLVALELSGNQFTGHLPASLSQSTNLEVLAVSVNMLTGTLPPMYGSLKHLQQLWTYNNNFDHATIPDSWQGMTAMQDFRVDGLYGDMPNWFDQWTDLQVLGVFDGFIDGSFPSSLCSIKQLQSLHISNNSLTGEIPSCICTFPKLTDIEISDNQFTGPIPDCIGEVTSLISIYFSRNSLSGELPRSIGDLRKLELLDVSSNMMFGTIPNSIDRLSDEIAMFSISHNKFSSVESGSNHFFKRIKDYKCAFDSNPWSCPLPAEVPKECGAVCSKCNTGSQHTDCNSCVQDESCGWCNEGPNCLEGQSNGPYTIYRCLPNDWSYSSLSCP